MNRRDKVFRKIVNPLLLKHMLDPFKYQGSCIAAGIPIKYLKYFKEITSCPIIVNTSFNVRGEPIVCNVQDAFKCFMGTDLDMLVCGDFILYKEKQDSTLMSEYKKKFVLD